MPSTPPAGAVHGLPLFLLRAEGATLLCASIWAYSRLSPRSSSPRRWLTFLGLLLLPDLGMAGYALNNTLGAAVYNAAHTEAPALMLLCAGLAGGSRGRAASGWALAWLAHVGLDRMCGFGLKYGEGFTHTHLGIF